MVNTVTLSFLTCSTLFNVSVSKRAATVLSAKSDSDVMFCLQSNQGLRIDKSLVYQSYPQDRINTQVIYRFFVNSSDVYT